ncbi:ATP-binding protein [Janthinobacterium sp. HLX7-2]|uniref:ATP-binding protein n=1 Tax=Janthinobacterium sp. HLX7-2 TaxID=1259331 RepID=UPI003F1E6E5A
MLTTVKKDISPNLGTTEHFVRFYDEDLVLLTEVGDFLDSSLRAGGSGIIIATPDHINALRRRLSGFWGESGGAELCSAKLLAFDADEMLSGFMIDEWPDESRFDAVVGNIIRATCANGRKVNAFGEMVALLCAKGQFDAAIRLEQMWSALAVQTPFSLFCAYPWKLFPTAESSAAFQRVCEAHDHVCGEDKLSVSTTAQDITSKIAELEQKARVMHAEVARRTKAEESLTQREKELADFLDNSAEGLHRVGMDGTILWANKAEMNMLGYRPEEYIGQHIARFHVDQTVIEDILTKLGSGETIYDYPARLRCKDGSVKHVVIHSNAYFEDGQLRYTRCFTRDATERHQRDEAYAEREKTLVELTEANQAKDEFLAMLGHELRNPLAPITMALELMRMRNENASKYEREVIERQVGHMNRLVEDLLDISRITRGRMELQLSEIDVSQFLIKAVEMASPLFEQRNHQFKFSCEENLHMTGDPDRLAQAVSNLLTNAARYTGKGGHIVLSATCVKSDWLCISVKDDGVGLPESMLGSIFELFFQAKQTIDRTQGGLGIGLALVKNIVELHGGTVEAKSNGIGRGSEFVLILPINGLSSKRTELKEAASLGTVIQKRRIMLVDDNVDAVNTLGRLLELSGHDVELFDNPIDALSAVRRFNPEIAILDIGLPGLNGYELADEIRAAMGDHSCRLIALTGYGQEADRTKSQAAGFEKHFVKPVSVDQVISCINSNDK